MGQERHTEMTQEQMTRYLRALHQVQAGIGFEITAGLISTEQKHVLTGVYSAAITHQAVMELLRDTGVVVPSEVGDAEVRLSIDTLLLAHAAITLLLIEKGTFTHHDYMDKLIEVTEREAQEHAQRLSTHYGRSITLV